MGRHSAGNGASVDPIVAAALQQRPASVEPGPPRHAPDGPGPQDGGRQVRAQQVRAQQEGGLGWPGEPGQGTGLGWPDADVATDRADVPAALETTGPRTDDPGTATPGTATPGTAIPGTTDPAGADKPPARRRLGWRRWFGGRVATRATSGSGAA